MTDTEILTALSAPFASSNIEWKPAGKVGKDGKTRVLPYLTGAAVTGRLNAVCGLSWSFDWSPVSTDAAGELMAVKGSLTIAGITRSNVGTASEWEPTKGAVTDSLKRCAVLFGAGAYLAELPEVWVTLDAQKRIPPAMLAKLAEHLEKRAHAVTLAA